MADTSLVGRVAAEMMEWMEDNHAEDDEVVTVVVAVEVMRRSDHATQIGYRCSDKREWVQRAFVKEVLRVAESDTEDIIEEGE